MNCDLDQVCFELVSFEKFEGVRGQKQRFEWLQALSANDGFFEGDFDADHTTSSRHPLNWLIALATRMPVAPKERDDALNWYAQVLLTENEVAKTGKQSSGTKQLSEFLKLNHKTVGKWERVRLTDRETPYLADRETLELLQNVVRAVVKSPRPVPFTKALGVEQEWQGRPMSAATLFAGLRHLLFYPCVYGNTLCLTAWPYQKLGVTEAELKPKKVLTDAEMDEAARPRLPDLPPPLSHAPPEQWTAPRIQQDTFCFLQTARTQKLQVKADGVLYARSANAVSDGLSALPTWFCLEPATRAQAAFSLAWEMDWIQVRGCGRQSEIKVTPTGEAWLSDPPAQRNLLLLELLRDPRALHPDASPNLFEALPMVLDPNRIRAGKKPFEQDVRDYLREFFQRLTEGVFYEMDALMAKSGTCQHPFRNREVFTGTRKYRSHVSPLEVDELWENFVARFFLYPLSAYGGLTLGFYENKTYVALTAAGRYLLGLTGELEIVEVAERVILQPNFDLVFMTPSPAALAALAPYCRRTSGGHIGTLFRLDRDAILTTVRHDGDAETILTDLQHYTGSVPDNVAAQVRSWCDSVLRVRTSRFMVIECPDKLSATRVLAAGNTFLSPLTDTVLKLKPRAKNSDLSRALAKHGIFLNQ